MSEPSRAKSARGPHPGYKENRNTLARDGACVVINYRASAEGARQTFAGIGADSANLVRFLCGHDCRFMLNAMLHANGAANMTIG